MLETRTEFSVCVCVCATLDIGVTGHGLIFRQRYVGSSVKSVIRAKYKMHMVMRA